MIKVALVFILFVVFSANAAQTSNTTNLIEFDCRELNDYDFRAWRPLGDFLQLDNTNPENWTIALDGRAASQTGVTNSPTVLLSTDVWTGKVTFSGTFRVTGAQPVDSVGILVGVVSPRTRFILIDWVNGNLTNLGCDGLVQKSFSTIPSGITVRAISNPLGQSERQQYCNLLSPISQPDIVSVWEHKAVQDRKPDTDYHFNITLNTFANSLTIHIFEKKNNTIFNATIVPETKEITENYTLGTFGVFATSQAAVFSNFTVFPHTCAGDFYVNCGYECPHHEHEDETDESVGSDDDDDDDDLDWWAIFLIVLLCLIVCLCCCVCIFAIVLFIRR